MIQLIPKKQDGSNGGTFRGNLCLMFYFFFATEMHFFASQFSTLFFSMKEVESGK
jgi:hypothetical protein